MEDVPELPAEAIEETPAETERLIEVVIRVCERHGFPRKGKTFPPDEQSPKG